MNVAFNTTLTRALAGAVLSVFLLTTGGAFGQEKQTRLTAAQESLREAANQSATFQDWISRYATAAGAQKDGLKGEGLSLAKQRHAAMAQLIKTDPASACALAVSSRVRQQLPADVAAEVEEQVSGIGDLSVLIFCPSRENPNPPPMERWVELNGQRYRAYVYGRRLSETSKKGIPLDGVVLDGVMAVAESPVRELAPDEVSPTAVAAPGYSVRRSKMPAGIPTVVAEIGGQQYRFASSEHLAQVKNALEQAESNIGLLPQRTAADILAPGTDVGSLPGTVTGGNPPTAWTTGGKRILVIRVDFSDRPGDPTVPDGSINCTAAYCQDVADHEVAPYYLASSYGFTSLTNTVTTQLYRMPQTAESYATSGDNDALHADARQLASADYTLSDYDRIVVVFTFLGDIAGSQIDYGGLAELGGPNVWVNGEFDFRVVAHELGHTYGLYHSGNYQVTDGNPISPAGTVIEYGNDFDTMGANFANDHRTDFNPFYKNVLGWVSDAQVRTVGTNAATYRLYAFDSDNNLQATNAPILGLKIVKDGTRTYWLGVLRNFTDNAYAQNGVYTIWAFNSPGAGGGGGFLSALLDMNTPGTSELDAPIQIGSSFTDPGINITIHPAAKGGTNPNGYVDVDINGGGGGGGGPAGPDILVVTNYITGGNGNGMIDFNECNDLNLVLTNAGTADATTVRLTLSTTTPGVALVQSRASVDLIPAGGVVSNLAPFEVSTTPDFIEGTPVDFTLVVKSDQSVTTNQFELQTGVLAAPVRYDSLLPVPIPDDNLAGASSPITVTNLPNAVGKVAVALYLPHTFDADLTLELIAPDGTTNLLAANVGGGGSGFGAACSPDSLRTVFDDGATTPITAGNAPFIGTFRPQSPLSVFNGKHGNAVNGTWQLHVVDGAALDVGTISCWSLFLYPVKGTDGGGQCPGADLALKMSDFPDPAVVGSNLVYTIMVTNAGPNTAASAIVTHNLPASVSFVSATSTRGSVNQSGGVVTANLGNLPIGGTATITVTVLPLVAGTITSTATITSTEPEINPPDNSVTVTTLVQVPSADLAVSLSAAPNPALVGGSLTYTATALNNGPTTASGVVITNLLPASVLITGATVSQGSVVIDGNVVICLVGTLTNGASATATINTTPLGAGTIFATARVVGNQVDPALANNVTTIATGVGEAADLAISLVDQPDPIVLNSNVTYLVTVTNRGPNPATGVVVNQSLPAAFSLVSSNVSQGSVVIGGSTAVWSAGSLPVGGSATFTLVGRGTAVGTMTSSASVSGTQADPNPADNTAVATTLVATPFVSVVGAGATLQAESFAPPNGAVDVGETVSVDFRLRNAGNIPNTNVVATLLATGGVTAPSGPQAYGVLTPGGLPVAKTFTFTAAGTNGGAVTATLQISDGGNTLSNVVFTFNLQRQLEFTNLAAITIPDVGSATPYPSTIAVSGVAGTVGQVTATLSNLNHSFAPDVDVLLVSPTGQRVVLMAAAGGTYSVTNATVTFSDTASQPVPAGDQIVSGTYQPASYDAAVTFPSPAPVAPYSSVLSAFANQDPNGTWSLYVVDRNSGDAGSILSGWRLGLTLISPVNKLADLGVAGAVTPGVGLVGDTATFAFVVTNRGPSVANGVVVTNTLSARLQLQSVSASQGVCTTNGNQVVCSLGSLSTNSSATVTLVARAVAAGAGSVSASVAGSEIDLNAANNVATLPVTNNLPLADMGTGLAVEPTAGVVGSNLTYTVMVTNNGPGKALGTVASFPVIGGMTFQSAVATKGQCNFSGGVVSCSFGDLVANETAMATITLVAQAPATVTNSVQVATQSNDTNAANNTASVVVPVVNPRPVIVAVGATAVTESQNPPNGAIDAGETVTLAFTLANTGQLPTTDLVATLQASGGVGAPSGAQSYGVLLPDGSPTARNFTFTAPDVPGGQVTATLDLSDNGAPLGSLTFTFGLSRGLSFTNTVPIIIPDRGIAAPYPSAITVAGVTGLVGKVTVKLNGFTHGFPSDVDAMLVGPQGQKLMLMSDAGGGYSVTNLALQFDDDATAGLPNAAALGSGNFKPTDYEPGDAMPAPAPAGVRSTQLAAFGGTDPNGNWSLYVVDDSTGDAGAINGGWELDLTITQPVSPLANLGIVAATSTPGSIFTEETVNYLVQVTNRGPADASGVIVTETLPAGATVESVSTSQGSSTSGAGVVSFNVGALAAGSVAQFEVQVRQTVAGNAANFVTVTAVQDDIDLSDNSATITTSVITPVPAQLSGAYDAPGQNFQVTLTGQAGVTYVLQGSLDLTTWTPIATNAAPGSGIIKFTDSSAPSHAKRFYRAIRLTP